MGPRTPDEDPYSREQIKALIFFFRQLNVGKTFHRIVFDAAKGILGNEADEPMILTKENMMRMDLLLADAMWNPIT